MLLHPWLSRLLMPVAVLAFYFLTPVGGGEPFGVLIGVLAAVLSVAVVVVVIVSEVRRAHRRLQPIHLLIALELILVGFALGYFMLAVSQPDQFNGLHTRLDALYFSLTTMSTVGYGDINAAGQTARLVVAVQLAFNLVFVAALVSLFQDRLRDRAARKVIEADPES